MNYKAKPQNKPIEVIKLEKEILSKSPAEKKRVAMELVFSKFTELLKLLS